MREHRAAIVSFNYASDGWFESNYHGRWFNFDNGLRRTTDQPQHPQHSIFVIGSSTVLDLDVPDNATIPSLLQKLFNAHYLHTYQVLNIGLSALNASQELARLHSVVLQPGDIVVFYDGVVDAGDAGANRLDFRRGRSLTGKACNWFERTVPDLALGQLYCEWVTQSLPPVGQDPADPARALADSQNYAKIIESVAHYTKAKGAQFYHFLQPHLLSQPLQPSEQEILNNHVNVPADEVTRITLAWPFFEEAQQSLAGDGIASWDFTHLLDAARSQHMSLYLDLVHVTERANDIIAGAMFDRIQAYQDSRVF